MIDAQSGIALESVHPVIPPTEGLGRLIEQPERIAKAEIDQAAQRRALGFRHQDLADPFGGIMHVLVCGGDVVIPEDCDVWVRLEFAGDPRRERLVPGKFVDISRGCADSRRAA